MAINNIINDQWQGHSHGEVEDALKALLAQMIQDIEAAGIPADGITAEMLATALRTKIANAVTDIQVNGSSRPSNNGIVTLDPYYTKTQIDGMLADVDDALGELADVATSGSYNDLADKPTILSQQQVQNLIEAALEDIDLDVDIPTKTSDLVNDSGFLTAQDVSGMVAATADLTIVENDYYIDITISSPALTVTSLAPMSATTKSGTFKVSGTHLKGDVTISMSATNWTMSVGGGVASQTLTLSPTDGILAETTITVTYSGSTDSTGNTITIASQDAVSKTVTANYTVTAGPTIFADDSLTIKAATGQSNTGTLQVTGSQLTAGINATVSGTGFSVSASESGTYGSSVSLPSSGGTLYVKFSPTGSTASTGTLTLESTGATSKTVDLMGAVAGTLSILPASASIGIVSGGSGTEQFTVTGANLTPASTASVAVSGTGMSADKQTLTVGQDGTINEVVTVTFSGSADSNGTLTVSHTDVDNDATASITGSIVTPLPTGATWIDGKLKYKVLTDQTKVSVSQVDSTTTTGAITIPSTVSDSGKTATLSDSSTQDGTGCTYTVTEIASSGFNTNNNITSLTLPNTITTIGTNGIRNMGNNSMTSLVIPDSVTTIGNNNIVDMKKLTSLTIGSGVTTIGDYFLGQCPSLSQITIPNSVTSIGTYFGYAGNARTLVDLGTGLSSINANSQFKMSDSGKVIIRFPGNDTRTLLSYNGVNFATSSGGYPCNATLYVPDALVDSYKTGYGWGVNNGGGWHMFDENNIKGLSELTE